LDTSLSYVSNEQSDITLASASNPLPKGTTEVEIYPCTLKSGVRVALVDTPGFDDTNRSDSAVLRDIANFLGTTYEKNILLTGIIYLHRISDPRVQGSAMRNLRMFESLCGFDGLRSVVLVTTMWNQLLTQVNGRELGEDRLQDLRENFWGDMLQRGSRMLQHDGSLQSAENILGDLINQRKLVVLDLQSPMVHEKLGLSDTTAGRELNAEMRAHEKKFQEEIQRIQHEAEVAQRDRDFDSVEEMRKLGAQYEDKIERIKEDSRKLNVDLERLKLEEAEKARVNQQSGKKMGKRRRDGF
jgi:hypothetical protein